MITVNVNERAEMPEEGARLVQVEGERVMLWPAGIGKGPLIILSRKEWSRLSREVMVALATADRQGEHHRKL